MAGSTRAAVAWVDAGTPHQAPVRTGSNKFARAQKRHAMLAEQLKRARAMRLGMDDASTTRPTTAEGPRHDAIQLPPRSQSTTPFDAPDDRSDVRSAQRRPGSGRPGSGRPGSGRPGSGRPGSGRSGSGRSGSGRLGSGRPGSGRPGGSVLMSATDIAASLRMQPEPGSPAAIAAQQERTRRAVAARVRQEKEIRKAQLAAQARRELKEKEEARLAKPATRLRSAGRKRTKISELPPRAQSAMEVERYLAEPEPEPELEPNAITKAKRQVTSKPKATSEPEPEWANQQSRHISSSACSQKGSLDRQFSDWESLLRQRLINQHRRHKGSDPVAVWVLRAFQKAFPVESRTVPCDSIAPATDVPALLHSLGVKKLPRAISQGLSIRYPCDSSCASTALKAIKETEHCVIDYRKFVLSIFPPTAELQPDGADSLDGAEGSSLARLTWEEFCDTVKRDSHDNQMRLQGCLNVAMHGAGMSMSVQTFCDAFALMRIGVAPAVAREYFERFIDGDKVVDIDEVVEQVWTGNRASHQAINRSDIVGLIHSRYPQAQALSTPAPSAATPSPAGSAAPSASVASPPSMPGPPSPDKCSSPVPSPLRSRQRQISGEKIKKPPSVAKNFAATVQSADIDCISSLGKNEADREHGCQQGDSSVHPLEQAWARQVASRFELTWALKISSSEPMPDTPRGLSLKSSISRKVADGLVGATTSALGGIWACKTKSTARAQYFEDMLALDDRTVSPPRQEISSQLDSVVSPVALSTKQWLPCSQKSPRLVSEEKCLSLEDVNHIVSEAVSLGRKYSTSWNYRKWRYMHDSVLQTLGYDASGGAKRGSTPAEDVSSMRLDSGDEVPSVPASELTVQTKGTGSDSGGTSSPPIEEPPGPTISMDDAGDAVANMAKSEETDTIKPAGATDGPGFISDGTSENGSRSSPRAAGAAAEPNTVVNDDLSTEERKLREECEALTKAFQVAREEHEAHKSPSAPVVGGSQPSERCSVDDDLVGAASERGQQRRQRHIPVTPSGQVPGCFSQKMRSPKTPRTTPGGADTPRKKPSPPIGGPATPRRMGSSPRSSRQNSSDGRLSGRKKTPRTPVGATTEQIWQAVQAQEMPVSTTRANKRSSQKKKIAIDGLQDLLELGGPLIRDSILNCLSWATLRRVRVVSKRFASVAARALEARPQVVAVGGGFNGVALASVIAYDLATASWSKLPDMHHARNNLALCSLDDGRLVAAGGFDENNAILGTVEMFDPRNGEWKAAARLTEGRSGCRASANPSGSRVLLTGGYNDDHDILGTVEEYNPETDSWSSMPAMKTPRYDHSATVIKPPGDRGKLIIAGGTDSRQVLLQSAEIFDLASMQWTSLQPMSNPRDQCSACVLGEDTVVVLGGSLSQEARKKTPRNASTSRVSPRGLRGGNGPLASCEMYSLMTNEWECSTRDVRGERGNRPSRRSTAIPPMIRKRSNFGSCSAGLDNGVIAAVGGEGSEGASTSAEVYVSSLKHWTMTTPIPRGSERYACGCASVVMRPGTTLWKSDEVTKLKNGGNLLVWDTRAAATTCAAGATSSADMAIGRKYYSRAGLTLIKVGPKAIMLNDGSEVACA